MHKLDDVLAQLRKAAPRCERLADTLSAPPASLSCLVKDALKDNHDMLVSSINGFAMQLQQAQQANTDCVHSKIKSEFKPIFIALCQASDIDVNDDGDDGDALMDSSHLYDKAYLIHKHKKRGKGK